MNEQKESNNELINIFNRKKLEMIGVIEILSSTDKEIFAKLQQDYIHISGDELSILRLEPEQKLMTISGKIKVVEYVLKINKKSFLKKVFK